MPKKGTKKRPKTRSLGLQWLDTGRPRPEQFQGSRCVVIALRLLAYLLRVWFGWVWGVQPPSKDMVVGALGLGRSNMFSRWLWPRFGPAFLGRSCW